MSFSKNVLRELRRELELAQERRDQAIARIRALEAILNGAGPVGSGPRSTQTKSIGFEKAQPSLRAAVLRRLELTSSTANDVAKYLEAQGFRVGGTTSLRERVAHELSRLRRRGMVRRRNGRYEVARPNLSAVEVMPEPEPAPAPDEGLALN